MRRTLALVGILLVGVTLALWLARGAHRGWTRTTVAVKTLDEITGIEAITYEDRFVPGVDFLGGGLASGTTLLVASRFVGRTHPTSTP